MEMGKEGSWEESLEETKVWKDDYKNRKEELDRKWEEEALPESEWRRLNRNDKDRFLDDFSFTVDGKTLFLQQGVANTPSTIGLTVWDSSLVLSKFLELEHQRGTFVGKGESVLEIGCGCGLVSLTAATLGANAIATDLKWITPLTQINADKNQQVIQAAGGSIKVQPLCWGVPEDWAEMPKIDYILAADCVYVAESMDVLLTTIHSIATETTKIIFAFQNHNDMTRHFWAKVGDYFEYQLVPKEELDGTYQDPAISLLRMEKKPKTVENASTNQ